MGCGAGCAAAGGGGGACCCTACVGAGAEGGACCWTGCAEAGAGGGTATVVAGGTDTESLGDGEVEPGDALGVADVVGVGEVVALAGLLVGVFSSGGAASEPITSSSRKTPMIPLAIGCRRIQAKAR